MPVFLPDEELVGYTTIKGALAGHRRQGALLDRHRRRLPGGTIFPGVKLYRAGKLVGHLPHALANTRVPKMVAGDVNAEVDRRAHRRRGAAARDRALGLEMFRDVVERMYDHGESIVRSYFEKIPDGAYVGEGVMDDDGISTTSGAVRAHARDRRLGPSASTIRMRPTHSRGRSTVRSPRPCPRLASRSRCSPDAARLRTKGTSARSRSWRARARCSIRARLLLVLVRLAECTGDGGHLPAISYVLAGRGVGVQRRRHRSLVWWGDREIPASLGPTALRIPSGRAVGARRRREQLDAARRSGDALLTDRGLGIEEPLAAGEGRAGTGLVRAGQTSRRVGSRHVLPHARGLVRDVGDRADEDGSVGHRRRRGGAPERRRAPPPANPELARGSARRRDCSSRRARRSSSTRAAAAGTGRRVSGTRKPC